MKYLLSILCAVILLTACNDYLNMVPEKDIETIESIFEQKGNAEAWLVGVYAIVSADMVDVNSNPAYLGADELTAADHIRNKIEPNGRTTYPGFRIAAGQQMSQNPYGNIWDKGVMGTSYYQAIRYCNVFIEQIDSVYNMEAFEKKQWKAEMKALKAFCYFELVRRYGPIVLVPENLNVDIDISSMKLPRVHVDTCFNVIVQLLDEAAEDLLYGRERVKLRAPFFCKESALALKAKALLYAASPLFNGNEFYSNFKGKNGEPLFSTKYDPEKWRLAAEAADAAVEACEFGEHRLYSGTGDRGSAFLNVMCDVEYSVHSQFNNPEAILEWKQSGYGFYSVFLPLILNDQNHYNPGIKQNISPTIKMVEMFYTDKGLPIDLDNTWDYTGRYRMNRESDSRYNNVVELHTDVLQLHLRREPRFYACIAADRTKWQRGPLVSKVNYNLTVEPRKGELFGTSSSILESSGYQNVTGYWCKKHLYSTTATYGYGVNVDETQVLIRLAELYLMQAEAWNEYLTAPDNEHVYAPLNKVRERAGIPDVVTSWRAYSKMPEKVGTREGMRDIIRQETNIEMAFEGHRFWNLRRWRVAHEELNEKQYGWNVLGATAREFYNNFEEPVPVRNDCKFTAPRDYLFPINAEEVLISSVVQNPGW